MSSGSDRNIPIITASLLDKHIFDAHTQDKRLPVIFRGVDIGTCRSKWSAEYLAAVLGDTEVKVHVCAESKLDFVNKNFLYKSLTFNEYISRSSWPKDAPLQEYFIDAHEKYYLRSLGSDVRKDVADIHKQYPQIAVDLTLPRVFTDEQFFSSVFRIASPDSQLWTHYDVMDNLLIQIVGAKEIILFPPSDLPYLYLQGDKSVILDPDDADPETFPLYTKATKYRGVLEPGDIIFIPALWFHNVKALDFSVAVNVFWRNLDVSMYDGKDVYGNKDLIPAARAQQGVNKALKTLDSLPVDYKQFYKLRLISQLQDSVTKQN